ncbi:MarR family winged helix-turn-helix transcriptional regulator [Intrasporangium sp.]|uniref:MarR family winged helix-turn-helix transcriptional regulator n=1 Tax=Intrasporangium sp. TaxID=1925024 RepID=UPI00293B5A15|nr:MarR family transcriptional regulator [Intrasporangium sp.]MDV3219920.1 MarR family transcriptional regulator [Intrasporangium sp.]
MSPPTSHAKTRTSDAKTRTPTRPRLDRRTPKDSVDRHVARWTGLIDGMDPEVEGAITRMQAITKRVRARKHASYAGTDETIEDYYTLHALLVQPYPEEATPAQLADACGVTRAAMTSRLDRLVERGHVTREVDPLDRRRILVRPTSSGRALWDKGLRLGMSIEEDALSPLTHKELVQLNSLLRKVVLHLES